MGKSSLAINSNVVFDRSINTEGADEDTENGGIDLFGSW